MFLNWDFGIPNSILCLNPRIRPWIRPWTFPLNFCLTLKMLQHSAWRKFLALLSCFAFLSFNFKTQLVSERFEFECTQKNLRLRQSSEATAAFMFPSYLHPDKKHFFWSPLGLTPVGVLSMCQVQLITSSSSDHYKIGLRGKERPFLYIAIKLNMEFMYQFSICKGYP